MAHFSQGVTYPIGRTISDEEKLHTVHMHMGAIVCFNTGKGKL